MPIKINCDNCGKAIELRRKGRFCSVKCKTALYERENPRHKIGRQSVITLDEIRYGIIRLDTIKDGCTLTFDAHRYTITKT
jgi:predicted nucleic acid-binding Zn ribbon protein